VAVSRAAVVVVSVVVRIKNDHIGKDKDKS
jgi:hypothetical protein